MKRILALLLCLATLLSLAACSTSLEEEMPATTAETTEAENKTEAGKSDAAKIDYPAVTDKLSWEKINAIPVATSDMSEEELRKIVLQYFELAQTFAWTPSEAYEYTITTFDKDVTLPAKKIYGGMPYVTNGLGNLYRLMDFYDPETGVMDMSKIKSPLYFGNQCSYGCFWAWSRVSNSLTFKFTNGMTLQNGSIPIGPYQYDTTKENFTGNDTTTAVCEANGEQIMFESYAKLEPADGLVYYIATADGGAGHVIMCSSDPVVVRNPDGTINGEESTITYMDQGASWHTMQQSDGTDYSVQGGVHAKTTFASLYKGSYLPFTIAEFQGTNPVEKGEASLSIEIGDSTTADALREATLNANYTISHVIVEAKDSEGKSLYTYTAYVGQGSAEVATYAFDMSKAIFPASLNKHANGTNTVTVKAWIGTGECIEVCNTLLTK